jgi:capsular exopolysaccharide synthesis family protein
MGKITEALKKAAEDRLARIEKLDEKTEVKYAFIARKTVESNIDPRIVSFYDPQSPITEQYRTLRTNIQSIKGEKPIRVMAVTSSSHSEGKTITAINLAISMARDLSRKNILLIDADLRRAKVSQYLGIRTENGLADILTNNTDLKEVLLNIGIDNLTVLPAGKMPQNPADILGSNRLNSLIALLRTKYDFVIFDTPPIISVTDAGLIGSRCDGVVMVVRASQTQQGVVKHSEHLLKQSQARLLGFVLTNVEYHIPAYIYRYL